ncbi:hypothetical protein EON83_28350 [bacterium]|nr:MAG: hypothetical protein EON83_28350 [bacterium]
MSALGFGLLVGALATICTVIHRAFERPGGINVFLLVSGISALVITPDLIKGFLGFIVGATIPPMVAALALHSKINAMAHQKAVDDERRAGDRAARQALREAAQAAADSWPSEQTGWNHISKAKMMHVAGQPSCYFMIDEKGGSLRVATYQVSQDFTLDSDFQVPVRGVISMNVASPSVTKTRTKTVPVTTIHHEKKSPVARGLVGGILLGPAGLVLGAASGLNSKATSTVSQEKILEDYETVGDPQLIIGTSDQTYPVLKFKFDPPTLAEEWMYRILGAQRQP